MTIATDEELAAVWDCDPSDTWEGSNRAVYDLGVAHGRIEAGEDVLHSAMAKRFFERGRAEGRREALVLTPEALERASVAVARLDWPNEQRVDVIEDLARDDMRLARARAALLAVGFTEPEKEP